MTRELLTLGLIEEYVKSCREKIQNLRNELGDEEWSDYGVAKKLGIAEAHIEFIETTLRTYHELKEEDSLKEEEYYRERGIIE